MAKGNEETEALLGKRKEQSEDGPSGLKLSCAPSSAVFQWVGLVTIAMITFGTSVAYDSIGALGPIIRNKMRIDAEGLADLYSVYHLPNLVLVFFGGLLSDRIGPRKASLIFSAAVVFGAVLVAVSGGLFGMLLGRFVFGMGSESLSVVQLGILTRWYSRAETTPSLGLACAFSLTINRIGTLVAFDVLPALAEGHANGLKRALIFVVVVCVFCLCCNLGYIFMDTQLEPLLPSAEAGGESGALSGSKKTAVYARTDGIDDSFTFYGVLANLRKFTTSYWLIVLICICHYSVMISYSDFAADFYHEQWGYPAKKASRIQSITTVIGLLLTPLMGAIVDRFGHRVHFMLIGSILLLPAHLSVSIVDMGPVLASILQGLASALVCSALWPSIALVLPYPLVNTAVGLMTALQNTALFTVPLIVGALRVKTGHYTAGMFFYLVLDVVAVIACAQLIARKDQGGTNILVLNAQQIHRLSLSNTGALDADDQACQDGDSTHTKDDAL